jgi:zinc/manganese transport system permease protein
MFAHELVRNEYLAGTFVALACGTAGWFVVLRAQVFAGDAFGHVAFVGAIGAAAIGVDERLGLFALTLAVAAALAVLGPRGRADDVVVGTVFTWILGLGVLLLTILATSAQGGQGIIVANTLFGSLTALTPGAAALAAAIGLAVAVGLALGFRPLLSATLDAELAGARGIPVRLLALAFLVAVALVTAESAQAVGTLLLLGLLAAPAGTAHRLTTRPWRGFLLSGAIAVVATWGGLALAYADSSLPASTAIVALAALAYALSAAAGSGAAESR